MTDIFEDVLVIVNCLLMAQMKALGPRPDTSELKNNSKIFIILEFFVQKVPFFRLPDKIFGNYPISKKPKSAKIARICQIYDHIFLNITSHVVCGLFFQFFPSFSNFFPIFSNFWNRAFSRIMPITPTQCALSYSLRARNRSRTISFHLSPQWLLWVIVNMFKNIRHSDWFQ